MTELFFTLKLLQMKKNTKKAYLFLAPTLVSLLLFSILPSLSVLVESLMRISNNGKVLGFCGLNNYKTLLKDSSFINSLKNTLLYTLLFVPLNTFFTLLAAALTRRKSKLSFIPEYIFFMPIAISLSSYSIIIKELFRGENNPINKLLSTNLSGISTPLGALMTLVILGIFLDFGLDYILLLCAFRSVDKSVIEAARMDGCGGRKLFYLIELPMIKDTLLATILLSLKNSLLISAPVIILTEGGPFRSTETIMFYYYTEAFRSNNRAIQNSLSSLVLISTAFILIIYNLKRRNK